MKLKKRRKSGRMRGSRYHGWAAKKHKGSGNVGGKGMAGTGKRADQKKTLILAKFENYFGKRGKILKRKSRKLEEINIEDIVKSLKGEKEAEFKNYKILGKGEINEAVTIKAEKFSENAKKKIEKAGGKAVELGKEEE